MLRIITSLTLLAVGLFANAQVTETRNVSPFTKIEITDGVEVIYTQKETLSFRVETSDGLGLSSLNATTSGDILKISCKGNGCEPVKVFISSPALSSVKASKGAHFTMTAPLHTNDFSAVLASEATFFGIVKADGVATLKARSNSVFNIRVESGLVVGNFQSGSKVNLSGISRNALIKTSDDALCNARNFVTEKAAVQAGDISNVMIHAATEIDVAVAEDAKVKYFGLPEKVSINPEAIASNNSISRKLVATEN